MSIVPYTRIPRADRLQETADLANQIAGTEFVQLAFRDRPAVIAAAILYGDELGIPPMQAVNKLFEVNGRIGIAAETQRALILREGHDIWVEETTLTKCTVAGRRKDSDATSRVTWTLDDARRARIDGKPSWKMYPRQMLLARASAELARAVFPDAIGGLAATEELEDSPASLDGADAGAAPPSKTSRRKRASIAAPATTPPAEPPDEPEPPPLPDEDDELMDEGQRKRMHAAAHKRGMDDRTIRLNYTSAVIGRRVQSSSELTHDEASRLIDALENDPSLADDG